MKKKDDSLIFPNGFDTIKSYQDFWNEVKEHPERFEFVMGKPIRKKGKCSI